MITEQFEWDNTWIEHTEDFTSPRLLYIGDSISIPTRSHMNVILRGAARVDGFATSKAADNPYFSDAVRLFATPQVSPLRVVLFNNGLHGWHLSDDADYPLHYGRLLSELQAVFPDAAFILPLTTPIADTVQNERVLARNHAVTAIAKKRGLPLLDYYAALSGLPSFLSSDGVHLQDDAYRLLAETAVAAVDRIIDKRQEP